MTRRLRTIVLLATALFLGACAAAYDNPTTAPSSPPVGLAPQVTVREAAALRVDGAFMLDVREPSEWDAGHIPGATLIPLGQLSSRLSEVPRDRMVVTVCRSGNRSAQARDILIAAGFSSVTSMAGGMNDWVAANLEVVTGP